MEALEPQLDARINARGWHALFGQTLPLREFMLWKTQTRRHYDVQLPQSVQAVTVVFMDDFASLGWAGFATCDRAHTGGWTKPDVLYAVRSVYDLDSEDFRVGFLAHEAQHFRDHANFPVLEQPELEYRVKLIELASGRTTLYQTLDAFAAMSAPIVPFRTVSPTAASCTTCAHSCSPAMPRVRGNRPASNASTRWRRTCCAPIRRGSLPHGHGARRSAIDAAREQ
jgi:hypothetical protein